MKTCTINGCNKKYYGKGFCCMHYTRNRNYGSPYIIKEIKGQLRKQNIIYQTYIGIKQRCNNKNRQDYKYYGGRGITICNRWLGVDGFTNFCDDMGERPEGYSIDRIDNDGNYEPNNCRWANIYQQRCNKRNNNNTPGVHFCNTLNRRVSRLIIKGKNIYLGSYKEYKDAISSRKNAEKKYNIIL